MISLKGHYRPWHKKKRTWILLISLVGVLIFVLNLPLELPRNIGYFAKAYSEPKICDEALLIARKNSKVIEVLGELKTIGTLDLLSGSVWYSKEGDSVMITADVKGSKIIKDIRSKMDLFATKNNDQGSMKKYKFVLRSH